MAKGGARPEQDDRRAALHAPSFDLDPAPQALGFFIERGNEAIYISTREGSGTGFSS